MMLSYPSIRAGTLAMHVAELLVCLGIQLATKGLSRSCRLLKVSCDPANPNCTSFKGLVVSIRWYLGYSKGSLGVLEDKLSTGPGHRRKARRKAVQADDEASG